MYSSFYSKTETFQNGRFNCSKKRKKKANHEIPKKTNVYNL